MPVRVFVVHAKRGRWQGVCIPQYAVNPLRPIRHTRLARIARALALLVVLLVVSFFTIAAVEARRLRIERIDLKSSKLPPEFDGTRLVFVADIHAGPYLGTDRMQALVDTVNGLDPDILVLGGDYVGGRTNGAGVFYSAAKGFNARLAKVAVLGNHDVWEGASEARAGLSAAGFTVLENAGLRVEHAGATIHLAGVDDLYTGRPDCAEAGSGIEPSDFAVLVSHNPDTLDGQLPDTATTWDLALAGHTHGGQVTFFGMVAPIMPSRFGERYRNGWRTEHDVPILVSNGVGTVTAPLRFFARPEIHVITLRRG